MALPTVLVVDDETEIRERIGELIRHFGYQALTAGSAEEALAAFQPTPPDMALVDLRLPDLTGIELVRRMRASLPRLPVAIITGHASIANAVEAIRNGAFDYLPKPFKVRELQEIVGRGLRLARSQRSGPVVLHQVSLNVRLSLPSSLEAIDGVVATLTRSLELTGAAGQASLRDVLIATEELLHNAVTHGNGLDARKKVDILLDAAPTMLRVTVSDEGPGFDSRVYLDEAETGGDDLPVAHGLAMVRQLVDELHFSDGGRSVNFAKRLSARVA